MGCIRAGATESLIGRRGFLGGLLGTAALVADPDPLLWKPGKLISIPPEVHVPPLHQFFVQFLLPQSLTEAGSVLFHCYE